VEGVLLRLFLSLLLLWSGRVQVWLAEAGLQPRRAELVSRTWSIRVKRLEGIIRNTWLPLHGKAACPSAGQVRKGDSWKVSGEVSSG